MSLKGLSTLKALRALTSNPSICRLARIELTTLQILKTDIIFSNAKELKRIISFANIRKKYYIFLQELIMNEGFIIFIAN